MIGKIIKTMRHDANLSQEELANKIFIGRTTLSDYERMKTDVNFEILEKIANACGYNIYFQKNKDKNNILTTENISRKEI